MVGLGVFVRVILVIITKIRDVIKSSQLPFTALSLPFLLVTTVIYLVNKPTRVMPNQKKRAKSVEDEFHSCEGEDMQEGQLNQLDIS